MQKPDWAERKIDDVEPMKRIAQVCQHEVRDAIRSQILGPKRADEHWDVTQYEDTGRDHSGK